MSSAGSSVSLRVDNDTLETSSCEPVLRSAPSCDNVSLICSAVRVRVPSSNMSRVRLAVPGVAN